MNDRTQATIWKKNNSIIDPDIMGFMIGNDIELDGELLPYDILASKAHVQALHRADLLNADETERLCAALDECLKAFQNGQFVLSKQFEDGHSAIEYFLIEKLGDTGKKVHSGRSRNDQVLVATRLWLKGQLSQLHQLCVDLASQFLQRAKQDNLPMPGYTHLQRAVVSSTAHWCAGFAESMLDNVQLIADSHALIDSNPLGTAAGYGVNLPLDRQHSTESLGFQRLQLNPMYVQNSRGKLELHALNALHQVLLDTRRLAWDISLFCSSEYQFIHLPDRYTTGSSIMPNKRNPDFIELLRGMPAISLGAITEINNLLSLPSGYQRDLQLTKAPMMRAFRSGLTAIKLLPDLIGHFEWNQQTMLDAIEPSMLATDKAIKMVSQGIPFREAYQTVGNDLSQLTTDNIQQAALDSIDQRTSPGASGNLMLELLHSRLQSLVKI